MFEKSRCDLQLFHFIYRWNIGYIILIFNFNEFGVA